MMKESGLRKVLRTKVKEAGSQKKWAELNGFQRSQVSETLKGRKSFSAKMLKAIGAEIDYIINDKSSNNSVKLACDKTDSIK